MFPSVVVSEFPSLVILEAPSPEVPSLVVPPLSAVLPVMTTAILCVWGAHTATASPELSSRLVKDTESVPELSVLPVGFKATGLPLHSLCSLSRPWRISLNSLCSLPAPLQPQRPILNHPYQLHYGQAVLELSVLSAMATKVIPELSVVRVGSAVATEVVPELSVLPVGSTMGMKASPELSVLPVRTVVVMKAVFKHSVLSDGSARASEATLKSL